MVSDRPSAACCELAIRVSMPWRIRVLARVDLVGRRRIGRDRRDRVHHRLAHLVERLVVAERRGRGDEARIVQLLEAHADRRAPSCCRPAPCRGVRCRRRRRVRRRRDHDAGQHFERGRIRMGERRRVPCGHHHRGRSHAAQLDEPLAVLRGLDRVRRVQRARRPRNRADRVGHHRERLRGVELSGDDEHGVVRLVVLAIERRQPIDRHALDVGARADDGLAVVVPEVGRRDDALLEDVLGVVLAALELVAHDGHLGVEQRLLHPHVDHALGFESERPPEVLVAGRDGLEIVGAVVVRAAVPLRAVVGQFLLDVAVVRRADEVQVLEQMRHAGLAVALEARADQVRHVDRDLGVRRIGEQQDAQPVGIRVFGDAAEAGFLLDAARQGLRERRVNQRQKGSDQAPCLAHNGLRFQAEYNAPSASHSE